MLPSVPLTPSVGLIVNVPLASITHEQVPDVPDAISSAAFAPDSPLVCSPDDFTSLGVASKTTPSISLVVSSFTDFSDFVALFISTSPPDCGKSVVYQ